MTKAALPGLIRRLLARRRARGEERLLPREESPAWDRTQPIALEQVREAFERAGGCTIGLEEELMIVDPATLELAPLNAQLLEAAGDDRLFHPELRACQVEIATPVCRKVSEACGWLEHGRRRLLEAAGESARLLAAGTHPASADWGDLTEQARYRLIEEEYAWAARRSLVCGLHVHVAVGGADRSLAVFNALRSYLPEIAALAANSPFFEGEDTGLCSIRPKLAEALPRTGVPPAFASWEEFVGFLHWGRAGGLFPDGTFMWWDLRPHPGHGTIELRVADSQTRIADAAAIAAVVQTLAASLAARYDAREPLPVYPEYRIAENSWRALRYGVRGTLVALGTGRREPARERIRALLDELEPTARELDCSLELTAARALVAGNGADRQRYVAERDGIEGLVAWLVDETGASTCRLEPVRPS